MRSARELLREGLASLGLPADCTEPLLRYGELLEEWNRVMNLTAITDPREVATLHFLDSAALSALVSSGTVVDVGTGAGFPGLPLRIVAPEVRLTLLDAQQKRITFLDAVCRELGLEDVTRVHGRAEEFARDHRESFDTAVSRAVASLPVLAELCLPLVRVGGRFIALKSVDTEEEIRSAERAFSILGGELEEVRDYRVPGTEIVHRFVAVKKVEACPEGYPRAFARIRKKPL